MLIFGIVLFIIIFVVVYIISGVALSELYQKKNISVSFWSFLLLFTPILNTITLILMDPNSRKSIKEFFSFKKFFREFKSN